MRKCFFIFVFILMVSTSYVYAKDSNIMDMNNPSVELLKQLSSNGEMNRQNDILINKAYIEEDTQRVKNLKQKFYQDIYGLDYDKKNPDKE